MLRPSLRRHYPASLGEYKGTVLSYHSILFDTQETVPLHLKVTIYNEGISSKVHPVFFLSLFTILNELHNIKEVLKINDNSFGGEEKVFDLILGLLGGFMGGGAIVLFYGCHGTIKRRWSKFEQY
jgi:hypothetical protein